jgi:hypothetical protein
MATQAVTMTQTVENVSADAQGVVGVRYINTYTDAQGKIIQEAVAGEYIMPGDDYSQKDSKVIAVCQAVQTQSVIDAFKAAQQQKAV